MSTPETDPSRLPGVGPVDFALAPALRARLLGTGLVAIGVVVVLGVLLTWWTGLSSVFVSGLVVLAVVGVLILGMLVGVRHWVLRLDEHGYRVRVLRSAQGSAQGSAQARTARWTDVLDLQATTAAGPRCVVLRLRDGRTTVLPVDAIEGGPTTLTDALAAHLDRGNGYRRLR
ncbi:MAG: hypothetical protein ABIW17_11395 [Marmoricola sp.]